MHSHGEVTTLKQGQLPRAGAPHRTRGPAQAAKAEQVRSEEPPAGTVWLEQCKANKPDKTKLRLVQLKSGA